MAEIDPGRQHLHSIIAQHPALIFPLFFALLWLTITTILALFSGWFRLMTKFPDQAMQPALRLHRQSGSMGPGVSMRGILTLSVGTAGLRVGIMRPFGPFCRDFLVPWQAVSVTRKTSFFQPVAKLQFGNPAIGSLTLPADVADRLARAVPAKWPHTDHIRKQNPRDTMQRLFKQWAMTTCAAALFFTLMPLALAPPQSRPPIAVAILFPAVACGAFTIIQYFRERS